MAPDLGVMLRRPAGAVEVYWFIQFDAKLFQGLAKTSGKAQLVVCEKPGKRQFGLSSTLFGAFEIARK